MERDLPCERVVDLFSCCKKEDYLLIFSFFVVVGTFGNCNKSKAIVGLVTKGF